MDSLQSRLLLSYLVTVAVTLGLTAIGLLAVIDSNRPELTRAELARVSSHVVSSAERGAPLSTLMAPPGPAGDSMSVVAFDANGRLLAADGSPWPADRPALIRTNFDDEGDSCDVVSGGTGRLQCSLVPIEDAALSAQAPEGAAGLAVVGTTMGRGAVIGGAEARILIAGLVGIVAAMVLTIHLSRTIAAPLTNIARAARRVAQGNYQQRVTVTGPAEVRDLAQQFNNMTEQVQISGQAMRDLLVNISHEIKTPLTSVRGFSGALRDGTIDDEEGRARAYHVIDQETQRLLRLVQNLLDLSRIESGQVTMHRTECEISELLLDVAELFEQQCLDAGVALDVAPATDLRVMADADRIEQVLHNLISNAIQHTPPGGQITLSAEPDGTRQARVSVADSGRGMTPEEVARVFERFYRAGTSADGKGHGLGLAISREIVRAHDGEMRVESEPGRGSTFIFTLPTAVPVARSAVAPRR